MATHSAAADDDVGPISLGGEVVGKPGGLAADTELVADDYYEIYEDVFPVGEGYTISVSIGGANGIPAGTIEELVTPNDDNATFTLPALAADRSLTMTRGADFEFAWTTPAGNDDQVVALRLTSGANLTSARLYCAFPAAAGSGRISAKLLDLLHYEVETEDGGTTSAQGTLSGRLGGAAILGLPSAAYFVETIRSDSSNWAQPVTIKFVEP